MQEWPKISFESFLNEKRIILDKICDLDQSLPL